MRSIGITIVFNNKSLTKHIFALTFTFKKFIIEELIMISLKRHSDDNVHQSRSIYRFCLNYSYIFFKQGTTNLFINILTNFTMCVIKKKLVF